MQRHLFADEHQQFRSSFRRFLETEIQPHYEEWESEGIIPRAAIAAAAELGLLGMAYPEEFGGGGTEDFRFSVVVAEEIAPGNHELRAHTRSHYRHLWAVLPAHVYAGTAGALVSRIDRRLTHPSSGDDRTRNRF